MIASLVETICIDCTIEHGW